MSCPLTEKIFAAIDADGSETIEFEEFKNYTEKFPQILGGKTAEEVFKNIDVNGDTQLTKEELKLFIEQNKDRLQGV